jgi:RHS repeat-associated protein
VSNESENVKVWFDDLQVAHTSTLTAQATDYGVWGDVVRESKLEEESYRYGYQGQFAEKDEETGWGHFELREYDAVVGRWLVIDPANQYPSPYVAFGNDPMNRVDPDGGEDGPGNGSLIYHDFSAEFALTNFFIAERRVERDGGSAWQSGLEGFAGGWMATWEGIKHEFTWEGTKERILSAAINPLMQTASTSLSLVSTLVEVGTGVANGDYSANDYAYGGGFLVEKGFEIIALRRITSGLAGEAALGSGIGPLKQWFRMGNSYSKAGTFDTYGVRWGASPARNGKFIKQIGSSNLQVFNQKIRNWKIPGDSWRTADPGHFHFYKR